jgi:hypothetical protein
MPALPPCRLTATLASSAPVGVVLRRGPSEQVCVIHWDLRHDQFDVGQWLKGRILKSALSPSGEWLVTFCSAGGQPWTNLSRPPYLSAHAAWHKNNHWSGGGCFLSDHHLLLMHSAEEIEAGAFSGAVPAGMTVELADLQEMWRLEMRACSWEILPVEVKPERPWWWRPTPWMDPPQPWAKTARLGHKLIQWDKAKATIQSPDGSMLADVSPFHWRDLDLHGDGDLLFSDQGRLYRLPARSLLAGFRDAAGIVEASTLLADFRNLTFEEKAAPDWAIPHHRR